MDTSQDWKEVYSYKIYFKIDFQDIWRNINNFTSFKTQHQWLLQLVVDQTISVSPETNLKTISEIGWWLDKTVTFLLKNILTLQHCQDRSMMVITVVRANGSLLHCCGRIYWQHYQDRFVVAIVVGRAIQQWYSLLST